ncbi:hypothetical protein EON79_15550 [bacterium]|nr:MAG: hypothetical protein EON79_15550 [bacterium]
MTLAPEKLDPELARQIEAAAAKGESVILEREGQPFGELRLNKALEAMAVDWTPGRGSHTVISMGDVISPVVHDEDAALERDWF